MKNKIVIHRIIFIVIFTLISFYIILPPVNIQSPDFYKYLLLIYVIWKASGLISIRERIQIFSKSGILKKNNSSFKSVDIYAVLVIIVVIFIINLFFSPLFMSKSYANRITIDETSTFIEDVKLVDFNKIPLLDKDSSKKLGDRVMGQMPELVSQFYVSDKYTQINYNDEIIRVTPLEYDGLIKWFTNRKVGVKGYITVDSVDGESELIKLENGMKIMPSAYFNEDLKRYLRFNYPTKVFAEESFEIDNERNPYWIIPTIKYTAIGLKREIEGVIILNPISGESEYYDVTNIPTWVDQVYKADLIIEQVDNWGSYQNGFLNSIFGQKGVVQTTDGYNYMVQNDDVFMYTGITSVSNDEANIGFILTNLRTKETKYYAVPGAEEYSAMDSAEGQVQQMEYKATFPLLINLNNRPTYLISLKDNAQLVKMYAFVDVVDYQKVVVSDASLGIEEAARIYLESVKLEENDSEMITKEIIIKNIKDGVIEGNTYYYVTDQDNKNYRISLKNNETTLPFLKINDTITISYYDSEGLINIISIK